MTPDRPDRASPASVDAWLDDLIARHEALLPRPQFLKAIRALSIRYVERRDSIARGAAADSAGKRAAFAGFYAPLHFLTVRAILREIGAPSVDDIVDLGCGTGVAGAAWALAAPGPPSVTGHDVAPWAVTEASRNLQGLCLRGRASTAEISQLQLRASPARGFIAAWSLNELDAGRRARVIGQLELAAQKGSPVLIIEPIARRALPWWPDVERKAAQAGGRSDEWRFDDPLPPRLASLSRDAGFARDALTARSIAMAWK